MNKVLLGCACAICSVMIGGCRSAEKIEHGLRYQLAEQTVKYMEKKKIEYLDTPCELKEEAFDKIAAEVKEMIIKK